MITFNNNFNSFPAVHIWYLRLWYTGSTQENVQMEMSKHAWKIVDWDIKHHRAFLFGLNTPFQTNIMRVILSHISLAGLFEVVSHYLVYAYFCQ